MPQAGPSSKPKHDYQHPSTMAQQERNHPLYLSKGTIYMDFKEETAATNNYFKLQM